MAELNHHWLLDHAPCPMIVLDDQDRVIHLNQSASRLLGRAADRVLGIPLSELLPPVAREGRASPPVASGMGARGHRGFTALRMPDGTESTYEIRDFEATSAPASLAADGLRVALLLECPKEPVPSAAPTDVTSLASGLQSLAESAAASGALSNPTSWLDSVINSLMGDFGASSVRIWLRDLQHPEALHLAACSDRASSERPFGSVPDWEAPELEEMATQHEPVIRPIPPSEDEPAAHGSPDAVERVVILLPLRSDGTSFGLIEVVTSRPLTDDFRSALSAFAAIVAVSLREMSLWQEARSARDESLRHQAKLMTILNVLPVGVVVVEGPDGELTLVNQAARAIGGDSSPLSTSQPIASLREAMPIYRPSGEVYKTEERPLWRSLHHGETVRETVIIRRQDGQDLLLEVASAPFPSLYKGAVAAYRNITEEHRLNAELEERAGQLKALLDHLPVGVMYFDAHGICRASNGPARKLLGLSRANMLEVISADLFATARELHGALSSCLENRVPQTLVNVPWMQSSGSYGTRYLDWRFQPLPSVHRRGPGVLALIVDVTERKLTADGLRRAVESAERVSRSKTQFLTALSHDLRTPVNALSLQAEWLTVVSERQHQPDPELLALASDIRKATTNLIDLLNDLLELTLFDSGAIEYQISTFPLDEWLDSTLSPLKMQAGAKGLRLSWSVDRPGWIVQADRVKLGRVLVNLTSNAVKFTESGSVDVNAGRSEEGGLRLVVRDTGPGIPEDQLERIFDEFSQLRNPERDRTKGTGLGLAISRRLISGAGGRLLVESALGQGSTFSALYPHGHLIEPPRETAPSLLEPPLVPADRDEHGRSYILLVEDDPFSRRTMSKLLERAGYEVRGAEDGPQALELIRQQLPSLVLLDLMLPGMDGSQLLRRIRAIADREVLPVVVLSGDVLSGRSTVLRSLDVHGILSKPIDFNELIQYVNQLIAPSLHR